jgi:hypothetical protein
MLQNPFSKDYTSPADQAWRTGESPDQGTLGPYRHADQDPASFRNSFVSKLRHNPDYKTFYSGNIYSADTAAASQQKIDTAAETSTASFKDPGNNTLANDFLTKYSQGVDRGLIEEDRAVKPENLARLTNEPAAARISSKDPNTVNKFRSQGVSV